MSCMTEECTTVKSIHTEHEWVLKLTAIVLLLCVLRWGLHTKALSHDPAPEGPLPVLHPETCTQPWTDQQLHLPYSFLAPGLPCLRSFLLPYVSLVYPSSTPFTSVLPPSLPLTISLRPSLPAGVGLPLPLAHWPSLLGSQHRSAFTERCLPFLGEGRVMFSIWCVCYGMQCNVCIP